MTDLLARDPPTQSEKVIDFQGLPVRLLTDGTGAYLKEPTLKDPYNQRYPFSCPCGNCHR